MNKVIFFDVDNTLVYREENTICKSTIKAIEQLKIEPPTTKVTGFLGKTFYRKLIDQAIEVVPASRIFRQLISSD